MVTQIKLSKKRKKGKRKSEYDTSRRNALFGNCRFDSHLGLCKVWQTRLSRTGPVSRPNPIRPCCFGSRAFLFLFILFNSVFVHVTTLMLHKYGIFLNNQTILSLFSKLNWLFLLIIEIFSYICTCNPEGKQDILGSYIPIHHLEQKSQTPKERQRIVRRRFNDWSGLW